MKLVQDADSGSRVGRPLARLVGHRQPGICAAVTGTAMMLTSSVDAPLIP